MEAVGRYLRVVIPAVVALLLVVGTWKGDDDNFPFGPFRMYSTTQSLDGEVRSLQLWGRYPCEPLTTLYFEDFALRRADVEGQLGKLEVDPRVLLAELARIHRRLHPSSPPIEALELRDRIYDLENGQPISESFRLVGTWRAPRGSQDCDA